jgi:ubiquinone/menaquinone biosynthesis C-methylase UbiE
MLNNNSDIINKNENEYFLFLSNNSLTICQKKELINYLKLKYNNYIEPNTNNQFNYYVNNIIENNDIEGMCRIKLLLNHFVNYNITEEIINKIIKTNKLTDSSIINYIFKSKKQSVRIIDIYQICDKWTYSIEYLSHLYLDNYLSKNIQKDDIKYLDIGCGSGKKTILFSKYLNLNKENMHGTDIKTWGPYQKSKNVLPFKFKYIENNKLNYSDNNFDIITCVLTLHHINKLEDFLKEIYRVLKDNGILILIEHCVYKDNDRIIINIQHMLFSALYDKQKDYIENPIYTQCYNDYEWNYIMNKNKFICETKNILNFGNEYTFKNKYDNIYYAFYKKIN